MTKDEALKLALQELEGIPFYRKYGVRISNAITAIKEALAQPEQEPVLNGWRLRDVYFDADGEPSMHRAPKQEPRNFCPRCGKRTPDLTTIHTCTPPRGLENT